MDKRDQHQISVDQSVALVPTVWDSLSLVAGIGGILRSIEEQRVSARKTTPMPSSAKEYYCTRILLHGNQAFFNSVHRQIPRIGIRP